MTAPAKSTAPGAPRCYVALGDSFSAGGPGERSAPWPERAARELRISEFHNLARPGAASAEVAAEQLDAALALDPQLVSLICGANDVLLSVRPDCDAFAALLDAMLARLGAAGRLVVTATYPAFAPGGLRARSRRRIAEGLARFNRVVRERSAGHGALCLDWNAHGHQARAPANLAPDGFHPSEAAHRIAAAAFARAVREALEPEREEAC